MDIERQNFLKEIENQIQQMENKIEDILNRKRFLGVDCNEEESAEIKGFVKEQLVQVGTKDVQMIADIQELFSIEYGEALDEMGK